MDLTETVIRCKEGDRNAFGLLYQATYGSMRKLVLKYAQDSDMADDVLHDGYLVAMTSIDSLKDASKAEGWLATIMKRLALQELKLRKARAADLLSALEISDEYSEDHLDRKLSMEDLDRIMDDLPDGYGKVFRLSVLEGLSHKEIGERLGIAPNSSSSQLSRAKLMMRRLVLQYGQRLGVILVVAAIVTVAWHVLVRVSPVEDPDVLVKKNSTSVTRQIAAPVPAMNPCQPTDPENVAELADDGESTDSFVSDDRLISEVSHDKSSENVGNVSDTENEYEGRGNTYIFDDSKNVLNQPKSRKHNGWSLSLACREAIPADISFHDDLRDNDCVNSENPSGDPSVGDSSESETARRVRRSAPSYSTVHHVPVVVEMSAEKRISSRFAIESGLRYTYLRTDFITEYQSLDLKSEKRQMIHYLGIPLKLKFRIADFNRFSLYLQGGGAMDVPVYGVNRYIDSKGAAAAPFSDKTERINAPVQWSVEGGLGLQYRVAPHVGLYVEPSLIYYFDPHSGIVTIRQDNPLNLAIPIGIRFSW